MKIKILETENIKVAICESEDIIIKDGQTALDFTVNIGYEHDCRNIAINKTAVVEDFLSCPQALSAKWHRNLSITAIGLL